MHRLARLRACWARQRRPSSDGSEASASLEENSDSLIGGCSETSWARVQVFDPHRFYTAPEVWRASHAARAQVYEALLRGQLRAVRRGKRWLIPGRAVIEWLERAGGRP